MSIFNPFMLGAIMLNVIVLSVLQKICFFNFFRAVLMSLKNVETGHWLATVSAIRSSCSSIAESPVAPVDSDLVSQGWNLPNFLIFVQLSLTEAGTFKSSSILVNSNTGNRIYT
jgi:hypothetical protein